MKGHRLLHPIDCVVHSHPTHNKAILGPDPTFTTFAYFQLLTLVFLERIDGDDGQIDVVILTGWVTQRPFMHRLLPQCRFWHGTSVAYTGPIEVPTVLRYMMRHRQRSKMKISTAEFPDELNRYEAAVETIARHVEEQRPDLLVLPEMPFTPWIFHTDTFEHAAWDDAVSLHAKWVERFSRDVSVPLISSRPTNVDGKRLNQAFYLDTERALHPLRSKYYLPNDYPAVETPWFDVGDAPGDIFEIAGHRVGVQLCSEIMYAETPRILGQKDIGLLVQSRATGNSPKWRAASVLAAATSGAFVIGANRRSVECDWFTGSSWVYSPAGELLTETTTDAPIRTVEIDMDQSASAKTAYPLTMFASYGAAD